MEFWLGLAIGLLIIEICTVNLVSIWFVIGSVVAFFSTFFTDLFYVQVIIFIIASIFALILTRPLMKKFKSSNVKTNLDMVIGKIGIITEDISEFGLGEVKVCGKKWTCYSEDNKKIKKDTKVLILSIEGVKLKVRVVEE